MGTHLTSAIWGPFWVFGSPFEAQERVKSQCSHVDHLIICESKISFNEFHASLQWNWYLYFKTFYYKELVCRLASGVLSNIDHQKKTRISTKYRPHSTLSTKYRPQKFLEKRTFTIFTFKSWDIHILGKWGLSWNMRDKWGLFQLRTFRKAFYMDHTALCRPYIQTIIETSIKVYVLNLKML